ncbi:MAG: hypothetical protein KDD33_08030 [Bdellovibrionales bacterium]|nr:hypothetical protein [Bdellovibrionales bacterium]
MKILVILLMFTVLIGCQSTGNPVDEQFVTIVIKHTEPEVWTANYKLTKPVAKLFFSRDQNVFRHKFFKFANSDFMIKIENGKEIVIRKDGSKFEEFKFSFTPYTDFLKQDYEFSLPFSDSSYAIYTGHFSVRTEHHDKIKEQFHIVPLKKEKLVFDGKSFKEQQIWVPKGDMESTYIYFGNAAPTESAQLGLLMDPGIPKWLKNSADKALPKIFELFGDEFQYTPDPTPFVIASAGDMNKDKVSRIGGGSAPGWVHFNISGKGWKKPSKDLEERFIYVIAHEGMHQFQGRANKDYLREGWLMEGSADYFSQWAMYKLGQITLSRLKEKISKSANQCVSILEEDPYILGNPSKNSNYTATYACGRVLHEAIHMVIAKKDPKGMISLWKKLYEKAKSNNGYFIPKSYFEILKEMGIKGSYINAAHEFIYSKQGNPRESIKNLFDMSGLKYKLRSPKNKEKGQQFIVL